MRSSVATSTEVPLRIQLVIEILPLLCGLPQSLWRQVSESLNHPDKQEILLVEEEVVRIAFIDKKRILTLSEVRLLKVSSVMH